MWAAKVIAAAAAADVDTAAETNWKHKVTPDWGDLMTYCQFDPLKQTSGKKLNQNKIIFIWGNVFENSVCKRSTILFKLDIVNTCVWTIKKMNQQGSPRRFNIKTVFLDFGISICRFWNSHDNKANLRDLIAASGLVILLKVDSNHRFFSWCDLEILMDDLEKQYCTFFISCQALCIISNPTMNSNWSYIPEMLNLGQNLWFFSLLWQCDFEIWWMTMKNNRAPLLYYFKLCASYQSHRWIQTGVTV